MTTAPAPTIAPARLEEIKTLLAPTAFHDAELFPLAGDASFRRYIRVKKSGNVAMLMDAPPAKEDVRPFIKVAEYISSQGFSAPTILARNVEAGLLLLEDLGDDSFTKVLKLENQSDGMKERELYAAAIDVLVAWADKSRQFSRPDKLPLPSYDMDLFMREVFLLTDWFLPQVIGKEKSVALRPEYEALWRDILSKAGLARDVFVHRDYHADNLMWVPSRAGEKRVGLLDFQDGVYGDAAYDMVSLLEDARRDVPKPLVDSMLERYIAASGVNREQFLLAYAVLGAQRNSKIVGIFARLAARDGKLNYLNYLPRVWGHLEHDVSHPALAPLKKWIDQHVSASYRGVISLKLNSEELQLTA